MMQATRTKRHHKARRHLSTVVWRLSAVLLSLLVSQAAHATSCAVSDFTIAEPVSIVEVRVVPPVEPLESQDQPLVSSSLDAFSFPNTRSLVQPLLVQPVGDALVVSTPITGENVTLNPGEPMVADLMIDGGTIMNVSRDTLELTLSTGNQVVLQPFQTLAVGQISTCTVKVWNQSLSVAGTGQTATATFQQISSTPKGCGWKVVFGSAYVVPNCVVITAKKLKVSDAILDLDVSACPSGTAIYAGIDITCTCPGAIPKHVGFQVKSKKP